MRVPVTSAPSSPAGSSVVPGTGEAEAVFGDVRSTLATGDAYHAPANEAEPEQAASRPARSARTSGRPGVARLTSASDDPPADPPSRPDVLTVDELAELLRLERKTVYACIARGEIPGVRRLGGAIRVHREAVLRWLAEGQGRTPRLRGSK